MQKGCSSLGRTGLAGVRSRAELGAGNRVTLGCEERCGKRLVVR